MKAILRRTRISPKKANLVAGMVRGKSVNDALSILKHMPKKGAKTLYKVVASAAANAKNNYSQNIDDLIITRLLVTMGPTYKRHLPISRGRVHPIRKRTSHITVEVGTVTGDKPVLKPVEPAKKVTKVEPKAEEKKAEKKTEAPKAEKKAAPRKEAKEDKKDDK